MAAAGTGRRAARTATVRKTRKPTAAIVAKCECRALIEDIAYFRACRFRDVDPGKCRQEDRSAAEAEIKAVLRKIRKCRA